ncbi:hypothetical protein P7C73_g5709, partial [Tremellales sp. Uapishka_1]
PIPEPIRVPSTSSQRSKREAYLTAALETPLDLVVLKDPVVPTRRDKTIGEHADGSVSTSTLPSVISLGHLQRKPKSTVRIASEGSSSTTTLPTITEGGTLPRRGAKRDEGLNRSKTAGAVMDRPRSGAEVQTEDILQPPLPFSRPTSDTTVKRAARRPLPPSEATIVQALNRSLPPTDTSTTRSRRSEVTIVPAPRDASIRPPASDTVNHAARYPLPPSTRVSRSTSDIQSPQKSPPGNRRHSITRKPAPLYEDATTGLDAGHASTSGHFHSDSRSTGVQYDGPALASVAAPPPFQPPEMDRKPMPHRQNLPLPRPALVSQASLDRLTTLSKKNGSTNNLQHLRFEPAMYPLPASHTTEMSTPTQPVASPTITIQRSLDKGSSDHSAPRLQFSPSSGQVERLREEEDHVSFEVPSGSRGRLRVSLAWMRDGIGRSRGSHTGESPGPPLPPKSPSTANKRGAEGQNRNPSPPPRPASPPPRPAQPYERPLTPPASPAKSDDVRHAKEYVDQQYQQFQRANTSPYYPYASGLTLPAYGPQVYQMQNAPFAYPQPQMTGWSGWNPGQQPPPHLEAPPRSPESIDPPSSRGNSPRPHPYPAPQQYRNPYGGQPRPSAWRRLFAGPRSWSASDNPSSIQAWRHQVPPGRAPTNAPRTHAPTALPPTQGYRTPTVWQRVLGKSSGSPNDQYYRNGQQFETMTSISRRNILPGYYDQHYPPRPARPLRPETPPLARPFPPPTRARDLPYPIRSGAMERHRLAMEMPRQAMEKHQRREERQRREIDKQRRRHERSRRRTERAQRHAGRAVGVGSPNQGVQTLQRGRNQSMVLDWVQKAMGKRTAIATAGEAERRRKSGERGKLQRSSRDLMPAFLRS